MNDANGILIKPGENTQAARVIPFTNVRQIVEMEPILKAYIYEAIEVEKAGLKVNFKKTILQNYRAKSDELEIGSPRRIHVRRLHHSNHSVWRWRVFLPEGQFYYLHVATKGAMDDKLPPPDQSRMFDAYGEVIVDVFAADSINGTPYDHKYVVTIMKEDPGGGSVTTRAAQVDLAGSNYLLAYEELAKDRTLSFAPDEPVVLFRGTNHGAPQSPADPSAEPGIIIWIEQAAPSP